MPAGSTALVSPAAAVQFLGMKPEVGMLAPEFAARVVDAQGSADFALADLRGEKVVLVFYPKDATPGCTTQACAMRDGWDDLGNKARVYGVSVDDEASHARFIQKEDLPYPLIVDTDKKIVEAYGVWVEKSMYGRSFMGTERTTFIIDEEGIITAILSKVRPKEHFAKVLEALS